MTHSVNDIECLLNVSNKRGLACAAPGRATCYGVTGWAPGA